MIRLLMIVLSLALALGCYSQNLESLLAEYARLNVHTALVAPSQSVDESPLWSPDSRMLAVNVEGRWYQVDTSKAILQPADWHKNAIGRISSSGGLSLLDVQEVGAWQKTTRTNPTVLIDGSGNKFEFVRRNVRTSFVVTPKRAKARVIWTSDLENCGELSLSPDGHWLAFICEENGVFVTSVDRVINQR